MRKTTSKMWAAAAGVTGIALLATACSGASDTPADEPSEGGTENITLTLGTFNEPGYTDEMFAAYEAENPGVTIENKKAATSNEARDNLNTRLASGSGASDVEMIEIDWLPELMQYPDKFADLTDPELADRWLPWKVEQATTPDGILLGYGTDIGPQAIAFRGDLLAAAGLPSTREDVAAALGGADATWDDYFAFGKQYTEATGKPFFDAAGAIYQGMINQVKNAYESDDGAIVAATNPEVKDIYDAVTTASVTDNLSAHLGQWSDDWTASFQTDGFATMLAPGWMLGVIEGNSAGVTGWDIADVFPGGAGNWGGSFMTVPAQGKNVEAAKKFAAWLTAPEQQLQAYKNKGTFPSQVEALASDELLGSTNAFFNNAPAGQILANRAEGIVAPFKGPNYFAVNDAMQSALTEVDVNGGDAAAQWDTFVSAVNALG
ncbi:ABC transporter substrate-binding protein [uncultured Cellulomonas sp.]|uniref:ABC transporter substrate-binding protein n=1 Tax=uncultured Cellulomonas sp. TaxID=189682 RepID=UPI0028EBEC49|nr:ABC transporter substrate-binding protein [uncultured Cellulomonas sp.]